MSESQLRENMFTEKSLRTWKFYVQVGVDFLANLQTEGQQLKTNSCTGILSTYVLKIFHIFNFKET